MSEEQACAQMPQYQCHKKVWALQIEDVDLVDGQWVLQFVDKHFAPKPMSGEWFNRHLPPDGVWEGGYYVAYPDGYTSFSPKQAFEEGYTRL